VKSMLVIRRSVRRHMRSRGSIAQTGRVRSCISTATASHARSS
jgi:hypothetical protein